MINLAKSAIAPVLGQRVPLRGPARLLNRSYAKAGWRPGDSEKRLTSSLGDDFYIDLSSFLEWQIWAFGSYERHLSELFRYLIKPADRCIDVGANIGVHTIRLSKLVGARGEVIAIEPDEELVRRCSKNLLLNRLTNVRLIQAAASERGAENVLLYSPEARDSNKARASLLPHAYLTGSAARVPAVRIDDVNDGPVTLIKIDVEGHEAAVVSGAANTIETYFPSIIFEYATELLGSESCSPFKWLHERGYEMFAIRQARNHFSGRESLELEYLHALSGNAHNILAILKSMVPQVTSLV